MQECNDLGKTRQRQSRRPCLCRHILPLPLPLPLSVDNDKHDTPPPSPLAFSLFVDNEDDEYHMPLPLPSPPLCIDDVMIMKMTRCRHHHRHHPLSLTVYRQGTWRDVMGMLSVTYSLSVVTRVVVHPACSSLLDLRPSMVMMPCQRGHMCILRWVSKLTLAFCLIYYLLH